MSSLENPQKTVVVKVRPPPEKDGLHGGRTLSRVYMSRDTLLGMMLFCFGQSKEGSLTF